MLHCDLFCGIQFRFTTPFSEKNMKFSYLVQPEVVHYIRHHTLHEHPAQAQLRAATEQQVPQVSVMLSSPEQMALMQLLLRLTGAKRVLEIGVFTGTIIFNLFIFFRIFSIIICLGHS